MKPIACLSVLSLIFALWSSSLVGSTPSPALNGHIVLEQLHNDQPTVPGQHTGDLWAEWIWLTRRRGRRWHKLHRWLAKLKRWHQERLKRWQRLRREWQVLMNGTLPVGLPARDAPPSAPEPQEARQTTAAAATLGMPPAQATSPEVVAEPPPSRSRRPGRPRTIPTAHVCCTDEECSSYGLLGSDPAHDIVGYGTYTTTQGEKRQMFLCKVCKNPFSETAGTPFFGLKTPMQTVCVALQELAEGLGVRAVARIRGVETDTVLDWLRKAGQHCEQVSAYMLQELHVSQVQLDELWTFVRKKERMLSDWEKLQTEYGDTWIWTAFDPVHKIVIAVLVGDRTEEEAVGLLNRLRACLSEACLPFLTSDTLPHYAYAILRVFGLWWQPQRQGTRGRFPEPRQVPPQGLNYATVHKERENGHVVRVTTQVVYGRMQDILACLEPLGQTINTAFVERMNLTLRHLLSRLHRKSLCFSKKREYLVYHLHLGLAYYHFGRDHSRLRVRLPQLIPTRGNGSPKKWEQRTPAMAAGLTDHRWSIRELLMCHVPACTLHTDRPT